MTVKTDDPLDFFIELADRTGVAVTAVKDGHVMIFTKKHLEGLLKAVNDGGREKCVVFVKHAAGQPKN